MINEEQVYKEFEKALIEALAIYKPGVNVSYQSLTTFIEDKVWESTLKYNRMVNLTKEKFFENLYKETPLDEYTKGITELWNIDHTYMDKSIEELRNMVIQKDFYNADMYGDGKVSKHSIKLENTWQEYTLVDKDLYRLNPESDFRKIEERYVNRHIKLYKNTLKRFKESTDRAKAIADFIPQYEKIDKTIPYFAHHDIISKTTGEVLHKAGDIIHYVDVSTYCNMLYNVNLTRSAWNRAIYDAKLLGNHMWYLPAHPFACPGCAFFQGYVYVDHAPTPREANILMKHGKPGYPQKQDTYGANPNSRIGVGHPNCKHIWASYWSEEQIQEDKFNSSEWEEKYKNKQKIQSLDLEKSRLLANRRVYKELGQQDLVDKTTEKIKKIRAKKKELE